MPNSPNQQQTIDKDLPVESEQNYGTPAVILEDKDEEIAGTADSSSRFTNTHKRQKLKKGKSYAKMLANERKLKTLEENLKPVPFCPSLCPDFISHEELLRRLGLWDFVHVEFDRDLRVDLIAQLIANFDSKLRYSYVNGFRIAVNRSDLARAFNIPTGRVSAAVELGVQLSEESITFLEKVVSFWMLLHDDTWIMPYEIVTWMKVIKDGFVEKVDWAGLLWFMVEKELTRGGQLVYCYYASHLQHLIRHQREELFREERGKVESEADAKEEENAKDGALDDGLNIELSLGLEKQEAKDAEMVDVEEDNEEGEREEEKPGISDEIMDADVPFVPRCDMQEAVTQDDDVENKIADEGKGEEEKPCLSDDKTDVEKKEHEMEGEGTGEEEKPWLSDEITDANVPFLPRCDMQEAATLDDNVEKKEYAVADEGKPWLFDEKTDVAMTLDDNVEKKEHSVADEGKPWLFDEKTDVAMTLDDDVEKKEHEMEDEGKGEVEKPWFSDERTDANAMADKGKGVEEKPRLSDEKTVVAITLDDDVEEKEHEMADGGKGEVEKPWFSDERIDGNVPLLQRHNMQEAVTLDDDVEKKEHEMADEGTGEEEKPWLFDEKTVVAMTLDDDVEEKESAMADEGKGEEEKPWLFDEKTVVAMTLDDDVEEKESEMADEGKGEEEKPWLFDEKTDANVPLLQTCNMQETITLDDDMAKKEDEIAEEDDNVEEEEEEEDTNEVEDEFDVRSQRQHQYRSAVELPASGSEMLSGGLFLGSGSKRDIDIDHGTDNHSLNKRLRTEGAWNQKPLDIRSCMEQIQHIAMNAMVLYEDKKRKEEQFKMNEQVLLNELRKRDNVIEHLKRSIMEEIQVRDEEIYRLKRELSIMAKIVDGYRNALKGTTRQFCEFKEKMGVTEKPYYRDAGPGGLMLSTAELERRRLKQEEENRNNRLFLEQIAKEAEDGFARQFEGFCNKVHMMDKKLMNLGDDVKNLRNKCGVVKTKDQISETPDGPPNE